MRTPLLVAILLTTCLHLSAAQDSKSQSSPIDTKLSKARDKYFTSLEKLKDSTIKRFDRAEKAAKKRANLVQLETIAKERESFEKEGRIPEHLPIGDYEKQLGLLRRDFGKALSEAVTSYVKKNELEKATPIQRELEALQDQIQLNALISEPRWTHSEISGVWRHLNGGIIEQAEARNDAVYLIGDPGLRNFDFTFEVKVLEGGGNVKARFFHKNDNEYYQFNVGGDTNKAYVLEHWYDGKWTGNPGGYIRATLDTNKWHTVQLKIRGPEFWCQCDNKQIFHETDKRFTSGFVGIGTVHTAAQFRNIKLTAPNGRLLWATP